MTELVQVGRADGIATVTLNRPDKLNALNKDMWRGVGAAFRELARDEAVRCVVLTGAGGKAFSPGADIAEFGTERAGVAQATAYGGLMHGAMGAIGDCPHPTLAVIHGICIGGGLELAAMCDLRICGASSRFGVPIARLGFPMAPAEIEILAAVAGPTVLRELLIEARVLDAREAFERGLVTRVVPDDDVAAEARAAAQRIARLSPQALRLNKRALRQFVTPPLGSAAAREPFYAYAPSAEHREGLDAFNEKRQPRF